MISVIMRKEMRIYFYSPIAYILITFFLVILSYLFFFFQQFFAGNSASLRGYFGIIPFLYMFFLPAITMRSWAEEYRQGSYELLATLPYKEFDLVIGKFLASFLLLCIMLAFTLPVPLSVLPFGEFEIGEIIGQYLGALFLGAAGISIGSFISATSKNQISAFFVTVLILLIFTLIGVVPNVMPMSHTLASVLRYFSFRAHYDSLLKGLIDTRDIMFYVLLISVSLWATTKALLLRKER